MKFLKSVYEIQQDPGDMDCGPSCAAFIRYGGPENVGGPKEAGSRVSSTDIQRLAARMRAETNQSRSENRGMWANDLEAILNEFAAVWDGKIFKFSVRNHQFQDVSESSFVQLQSWLDSLLGANPRGIPVVVQTDFGPHFVVYVGSDDNGVDVFDPAPGRHVGVPKRLSTVEFGRRVYEAVFFGSPAGWGVNVLVGTEDPNWYIRANDALGELDAKGWNFTWGEIVEAAADAEYHNSAVAADDAARKIASSSNVGVIEAPEGVFAVVQLKPVGQSLVKAAEDGSAEFDRNDSDSSSFLVRNFGRIASIRLLIGLGEGSERQTFVVDEISKGRTHRD